MEEELVNRILKLEKELKSTKYLVIFLILMFIVLSYQYITVQQKNMISVDLIRTKGLVLQDNLGNDVMLMGYPIPFSKNRKRSDIVNGLLMLDHNGTDRLFIGQESTLQVDGQLHHRINTDWGYLINDHHGEKRGSFGIIDSLNTMIFGLDYQNGEAIMLVAKPENAFMVINTDEGDLSRERIVLWHDRMNGGKSMIKLGDDQVDDRIKIQTAVGEEPYLQFKKLNGTKNQLLH